MTSFYGRMVSYCTFISKKSAFHKILSIEDINCEYFLFKIVELRLLTVYSRKVKKLIIQRRYYEQGEALSMSSLPMSSHQGSYGS
jgi:hypothetical protein